MSSRWECNMCSWSCILLTEGGDQPDVCPFFRSGDPAALSGQPAEEISSSFRRDIGNTEAV